MKVVLLFLCFIVMLSHEICYAAAAATSDSFGEELLVRPLPDGKVMAHFEFQIRAHNLASSGGKLLFLFKV